MLVDLCLHLADLHKSLVDTLAQGQESDASEIADEIVLLEGRILLTPSDGLKDAAVKLQILKIDLDEHMSEHQRLAFEDAVAVVSAKAVN